MTHVFVEKKKAPLKDGKPQLRHDEAQYTVYSEKSPVYSEKSPTHSK